MTKNLHEYLDSLTIDDNLCDVVERIAHAVSAVGNVVRDHAGISCKHVGKNVSGDDVSSVDRLVNELFMTLLCDVVSSISSEENEEIVEYKNDSKYNLVLDPLDGSKNVECNMPSGTIFGITDRIGHMHVAGYALYGTSTMLVLTFHPLYHGGAMIFKLDEDRSKFELVKDRVYVPQSGMFYSINEAYSQAWMSLTANSYDTKMERYLKFVKAAGHGSRNVGCMVADCHQVLLNGGLFAYPANLNSPTGKIRLMYEARPMAFIFECAGGSATTVAGTRLLELPVIDMHMTTSVVIGGMKNVELFHR